MHLLFLLALSITSISCGINDIPTYDEKVKSSWSQVENQYQRRADLIPNLVSTVQAYAERTGKKKFDSGVRARAAVRHTPMRDELVPACGATRHHPHTSPDHHGMCRLWQARAAHSGRTPSPHPHARNRARR